MSIFIPTNTATPRESAQQIEFRRQLDAIPSWSARAQKIEDKLQETTRALAARDEQLFVLRGDFDALTMNFWSEFAAGLGCYENPAQTIARQQARKASLSHQAAIFVASILTFLLAAWGVANGQLVVVLWVLVVGAIMLYFIISGPSKQIARAKRISTILAHEQQPFWLTGGASALSNLSIHPPQNVKWWWQGQTTFVFVSYLSARFSIDALTQELVWEDALSTNIRNDRLTSQMASTILQHLFAASNPRYQRLVENFNKVASLESEFEFLQSLKSDADREIANLVAELRQAEEHATRLRERQATEAARTRFVPQEEIRPQSATQEPPLSEVIISDELRQDLSRRLDRFLSGKMIGCPGLLLYGPSGSGKTAIARALSRLGSLELISVTVADLKGDVWIGSASKNVRELWIRARSATGKVLMFIDELDAIFPSRSGTEADVHTREIVSSFSAEWDGIEGREANILVLGATNRVEGVDPAIMSRFGTQKEVALPNKLARKKILSLELSRAGLGDLGLGQLDLETPAVAEGIYAQTAGMSGRDLHKLVEELAIAADSPNWEHLTIALLRWRSERSLERNTDATWDRLIVSQELKDDLQAYCRILRNYEEFKTKGVNLPRGALLYGPSGTGKTQIARTLSNEGGLSFIGCTTSDIKQGWVGHSAQKVREIFARARSQAPCILFIDELDVIAPVRGTYHDTITTEIVGELTQQLDGIRGNGPAVFVLAATNRPDAVDPAILSRFVEQIEIALPDQEQRKQLLEVFLRGVSCDDRLEITEQLAISTTHYSGRDLQGLCNKALLSAVKRAGNANGFTLHWTDFDQLNQLKA